MKQVIVIRTDLGMSIGKTAAQACHASIMSAFQCDDGDEKLNKWFIEGQAKIVVQVNSLEELNEIYDKCRNTYDLPYSYIIDHGRTELPPNTPTAVGIGPAEDNVINKITGQLALLR